ncbi:DUF1786 family protein [uncultured Desulfosarcina sp.]|uniref:DUF1786 family protein n=1 Tax=uncultured Desulfosarcina sp. TaxID=218289 RepID=UPI0029C7C7CD|nr:DUF1786 family protein [uncultured Desulfosarcina sp.]
MGRYLMLDIGAGTMDMLCFDTDQDLHYKAVVRSPVRVLADEIRQSRGNLVATGVEMGGGPVSQALIERTQTNEVVMSTSAAATIHHDVEKVTAHGIRVVADDEAEGLIGNPDFSSIRSGDLQIERIRRLVKGLGLPFSFDAVAICAQDHGVPPAGVSHLDFRHQMFTAVLEKEPTPHTLLYRSDEVPVEMNRLKSIAEDARSLPADRIYVMDSGMAAILGASKDILASGMQRLLVLDIATSHTVGAALEDGVLCGFFEYHTRDVTVERLDRLLEDLPDGKLSHRQILEEGGHGAYSRSAFGYDQVQRILATGPRRRMAASSALPIVFGAPWGDNMMTGTVGLLEAVRRREGLPELCYL